MDNAAEETTIDNLAVALKKTREADKDKGRAIMQQRALWDSLLENRIRLQKAATASNKLPHVRTSRRHSNPVSLIF
jgi:protein AATF/BFR2